MFTTIGAGLRGAGRRLVDAVPLLAPAVVKLWYVYVYLYVYGVNLWHRTNHEAPIRPFDLHDVPLDDELYWLGHETPRENGSVFQGSKFTYLGRVIGGDWDEQGQPFVETDLYQAFEAHFARGVDWEETAFFEQIVAEIEDGNPRWKCATRAEFLERCARLDELYESIATHGYKTQRELAQGDLDDPFNREKHSRLKRFVYDEITVCIGRDGTLLFNDGRDRLAIATVLGLETVPVCVLVRHEAWQQLRDDLAAGRVDWTDLPEHLHEHPDLRGLRPNDAIAEVDPGEGDDGARRLGVVGSE